jgi:hypothetical protein
MTTTIYLDVDGFINAIGRTHPEHKHTGFSEYRNIMANSYQIAYAPELIAALNELAARDDVTIKWLTTWEHDAAKILSPLIGLNGENWEVLTGDLHAWVGKDWWKYIAIRADTENLVDANVIWIDDDLSLEREALNWVNRFDNVHAFSPFAKHGLTAEELTRIRALVEADAA